MTLQSNPSAQTFFEFLNVPLSNKVRILLLTLIAPLALSFLFPLWRISMVAPQYPKGLFLDIYSYKLASGNEGRDLEEINVLNHYIGMRKIVREELVDLNWLPFAIGGLALLLLRAAALGNIRQLVDMSVVTAYVSCFALGRFAYMLYVFGHDLDEKAPMDVEPFTPAILGTKQVANFITNSWPLAGSWMIGIFAVGLWAVTAIALWEGRKHSARVNAAGTRPAMA